MRSRIPLLDLFRRRAYGVLIFWFWQAAASRNAAMAFRSGGVFLIRKPPSSATHTFWPNPCDATNRKPKANYLNLRRTDPTNKTCLAMGLRDLLKRRILGRKDKDDNNNEESEEAESSNNSPSVSSVNSVPSTTPIPSVKTGPSLASPEVNGQVAPPDQQETPKPERRVVRMAEDPTTGEVNVQKRFGSETVQEKINRVKAGKMTEEEKAAFLRTALSAGDTPLSREPLLQRKTASLDDSDAGRRRGKASPFPTDTIIRKSFSLGRNNDMNTSRDLAAFDSSLDTQKKKREYLDMVTNPERFRTYKTTAGTSQTTSLSDVSSDRYESDRYESDRYEPDRYDPKYFPGSAMSSSRKNSLVDSTISTPSPPPLPPPSVNVPPMPNDLGARLGAHAMASEKAAADLRRQAEEDRREKERLMEEERIEQELRDREAQRLREAELIRREREVVERKRAQEEALLKAEEERRRKEEERLRAMMQAQDAYWAKKMQAEREARERGGKGGKKGAEPPAPVSTVDATATNSSSEVLAGTSNETELSQDIPPPLPAPPVVAEAKVEPPSSPWGWTQRTAADILGRNPRKPSISTGATSSQSAFQAEQARQKEEIERTKAMQLERLKALNSPLPNRPVPNRGLTSSTNTNSFQPQWPSGAANTRNSGGLSRTTSQQPPQPLKDSSLDKVVPPPPSPPPPPPVATTTKTIGNMFSRPPPATSKPEVVSKPSSANKPPPVNYRTTAVNNNNNVVKPVKRVEEPVREETNTAPAKSKTPVIRQQIRQQLPFDEEDGIDRDSKGMSIADVMQRVNNENGETGNQQQRSKKWGIDMSRFRED